MNIWAMSIHAPWVWWIIDLHKRVETRGWKRAVVGELLMIHASKHWDISDSGYMLDMCAIYPELRESYRFREGFGSFLGVMRVTDIQPVEKLKPSLTEKELALGNYTPYEHRYGWVLEPVERFDKPIKARGNQMLWRVPYEYPRKTIVLGNLKVEKPS